MVMLTVMPDDAPACVELRTDDFDIAAARLQLAGVSFQQWIVKPLQVSAVTEQQVLDAYADEVSDICRREDFSLVDCVKLHPEPAPGWLHRAETARAAFQSEHRHAEREVRYFVGGRGCFYLHIGRSVLAIICEAGELLSMPAGIKHWFDMGPMPDMCAIRFFEQEEGWIGDFTGDRLANIFPSLPELIDAFEVRKCS